MLTIRNPHRPGRACSRVPDELLSELSGILHSRATWTREALTSDMGAVMGSFRFCRCYRKEETAVHEMVNSLIAVVDANEMATQAELSNEDLGDQNGASGPS